jgi:hypothetical protein
LIYLRQFFRFGNPFGVSDGSAVRCKENGRLFCPPPTPPTLRQAFDSARARVHNLAVALPHTGGVLMLGVFLRHTQKTCARLSTGQIAARAAFSAVECRRGDFMTTTVIKKLRRGPAAMTIDMHGRLQANSDVVFGTPKLSKQFKAAERLQSFLSQKLTDTNKGTKAKA